MLHFLDPNPEGRPAVLLLHGLGATAESWVLQLPSLSGAGFRPLAPDAPGFGRSPYDDRGWGIRRAAAALAALLDDLGLDSTHVVGLSMGGVVAQQFALDYPMRTRGLVLANTFAVLRPATLSGWLYFLRRFIVVHTLGMAAQAKVVARHVFPDPQQETLRQMVVASITGADPRAYRAAMRALGLFDSRKRLNEIAAPTLVVTGEDDTTVPGAPQGLLAAGIPGARQVLVAGAGHAVSIDRPDEFNRILIDFIRSAERKGGTN